MAGKVFRIPLGNNSYVHGVEDLIDQGYDVIEVELRKLVDDNDLADPKETDYHRALWKDDHKDWRIDGSKVSGWAYSDVIYGVRRRDGRIELSNGKHRCWALYNSGYDRVEMPVLDEPLSEGGTMDKSLNEDLEDLKANAKIVDYVEYKHSYCHALKPKLRKINYYANALKKPVNYIRAMVKGIIKDSPEVRWTDKEQWFMSKLNEFWPDSHELYRFIKNSIEKARDTWVYVDADGELIPELNADMISIPVGESLSEDIAKEIKIQGNEDIIEDEAELDPPIDLEYFPNMLGINLSAVEKEKWVRRDDGQLEKIEVDFIPEEKDMDEKEYAKKYADRPFDVEWDGHTATRRLDEGESESAFWDAANKGIIDTDAFAAEFKKDIPDAEKLFDLSGMLRHRGTWGAIKEMDKNSPAVKALKKLWKLQFVDGAKTMDRVKQEEERERIEAEKMEKHNKAHDAWKAKYEAQGAEVKAKPWWNDGLEKFVESNEKSIIYFQDAAGHCHKIKPAPWNMVRWEDYDGVGDDWIIVGAYTEYSNEARYTFQNSHYDEWYSVSNKASQESIRAMGVLLDPGRYDDDVGWGASGYSEKPKAEAEKDDHYFVNGMDRWFHRSVELYGTD